MSNLADMGIHETPNTRTETCETHGEFESKNYLGRIWSGCPECAKAAAEKARIEEDESGRALHLEIWQRTIRGAGIPERFMDRSLENYVADSDGKRRVLDFAIAYVADFNSSLKTGRSAVFCGKPGTGKTHIAASIGVEVMRRDKRRVLFCTVMRAIRRVKETWGRNSEETESQAIESLVTPDLLILDEVGVQFGSETEKLILFDVLNERYERRRPTLLITNLSLNDVKGYLGERIYDRLCEDGGEVVVFDWSSHRRAAQ